MNDLPTGTVAFLMTDIVGSTRLAATLGAAFPQLLDHHFALLGDAIRGNGGTLISSEGDSTFSVYPSVRQAIGAAVAAQRALAGHAWPGDATVTVRMGLHAGEAIRGGRDYTGIEVHRAARIMAAGHGGQILVSEIARGLAGDAAAGGVTFRDLGTHTLRDLPEPQHIYQLLVPDLPADFPPLRTPVTATPTNLPTLATRFVGRARELARVRDLIDANRLVTLTGPGGTGKTRLAIEAARGVLDQRPDGVWFVALESVRDPSLVLPAIAGVLGVADQPRRPVAAVLAEALAGRRPLLVLDNLEQVVDAAPDIAALLAAAPGIAVIATSRESLAVAGEQVFPVPPLALPDEPGRPSARDLAANDCVALFVERARSARPEFELSDANAPAVAAICRRLDGLPLALELAAARVNLLAPDQILARLDHRLSLLASSRRDLPERQRTLRGAIDWSHDLLAEPERAFFRRFGAFAGGADLDAVQAVIDPNGELAADPLDLASALVDRSLLRSVAEADGNRLEMLETIREYATERLESAGEAGAVRARHAAYFRDLASLGLPAPGAAGPSGAGLGHRLPILGRLERDLGNFRTAIRWCLESGDLATGLEIAASLRDFWYVRNHLTEGRRLLDELIAASAGEPPSALRFRALFAAGDLAGWQIDIARAIELSEEAFAIASALGDPGAEAASLRGIAWSYVYTRPEIAAERFAAAAEKAREIGDRWMESDTRRGEAIARLRMGDLDRGHEAAQASVEMIAGSGDEYATALGLAVLGLADARRGDVEVARNGIREALRRAHAAGAHIGIALGLEALGSLAIGAGDVARGVQLVAAAEGLRQGLGGSVSITIAGFPAPLDQARAMMDSADFERAFAEGQAMPTEDAIALALGDEGVSPG